MVCGIKDSDLGALEVLLIGGMGWAFQIVVPRDRRKNIQGLVS